jgi:4-hydroxybenzoate polyprenyltransferase
MRMSVSERHTVTRQPGVLHLCLAEARPGVQLLYAIRFSTGAALGILTSDGSLRWSVVAGLAAWVSAMMSVYILNGLMDVTEDRANGSKRPIACGALSERQATRAVITLAGLGLLLAALTPLRTLLMVIVALALGWMYSGPPWYVKRRPVGSASFLMVVGLASYAAGYWAADSGAPNASTVVFALAMSLSMGLVGVPVKDLSDVEGDRIAGRRSWPVMWGERRARIAICCVALGAGTAFLAAAIAVAPAMVPASVVTLAGFVTIGVVVLSTAGRGPRSHRRRGYRTFMISAYCAHVAAITGALVL